MRVSAERAKLRGPYYRIEDALDVPRAVQLGGPTLLMAAVARTDHEDRREVARAMTHWFPLSSDVLRRETEVLERHCADTARPVAPSGRWGRR